MRFVTRNVYVGLRVFEGHLLLLVDSNVSPYFVIAADRTLDVSFNIVSSELRCFVFFFGVVLDIVGAA